MRPESEAELVEILKSTKEPFRIVGGGTRDIGNPVEGLPLETGGLSGISLYEPGALTLVVKAGTALSDVDAALKSEGQRLAFEPMDHRALLGSSGTPTIGGVVSGNVSGPRRIQAGACRDYMLGVRFVDGRGTALSNGGRVMKNVTGYDLVKLMAGSRGTLGVLTEVSFKTLPIPETSACLLIEGLSDKEAVSVMSKALGSPYEITGAAHLPVGVDGAPVTMLRIEGFEKSVAYRADQLKTLFSGHELTVETDPDRLTAGWTYVRDVLPMKDADGDVWRLSVKPSDAPDIVARSGALKVVYDWGGGLIWLLTQPGTDLRARLKPFEGHATLVRAGQDSRQALSVFEPEIAPLSDISEGLRKRFDPKGLLNPGIMGA